MQKILLFSRTVWVAWLTSLDPRHDALQEFHGIAPYRLRQRYEFDHIDSALPAFDQGYEGLIAPDSLGDIGLRESRRLAGLDQHFDEVLMIALEDCLGHGPPAVNGLATQL